MNDRDGASHVDVGGYRLWTRVLGSGSPTVVFESGGGDDASAWSTVEPEIRARGGVTTVTYDRAGLGRSEPSPGPYRIDAEATALATALTARGVTGEIVPVAHSYGGFVSWLLAARDPRVVGLVFVDANLPEFFDPAQVARLSERFQRVAPIMEQKAPRVARVMIPVMDALPATTARMRATPLATTLPVIDIVPERTWVDLPEEVDAIRRAHTEFVAASPQRERVFATDSGHYVMQDRPELVVEAVVRLLGRLRARENDPVRVG